MGKTIRKIIFLDESRVWSFAVNKMERKQLRDYLFGYFFHTNAIELYFCTNLTNTSKDITGLTSKEKNRYMRFFDSSDLTSECIIYHSNANSHLWIVRQPIHGNQTNIFGTRAAYIFALKLYHENANGTCFKYFTYSNKKK